MINSREVSQETLIRNQSLRMEIYLYLFIFHFTQLELQTLYKLPFIKQF